jgi:hypothetical protein
MINEDEELLEKWFLIRNISSGTQKSYLIPLNEFLNVTKKTSAELITESKKESLSTLN